MFFRPGIGGSGETPPPVVADDTPVRGFGAERRGVAVPGVHHGLRRQGEQLRPDRLDDQIRVGPGPAGRARPAVEQGVTGEQKFRLVQALHG